MRKHHTKTKGDIGVLKAQVDLMEKGYTICVPLTEHAPFDIVIYKDGQFKRVQVKYRSLKNGIIDIDIRSSWSDKHGSHSKLYKKEIDLICAYCPDVDKCFYIPIENTTKKGRIRLRFDEPNKQMKNIRWAKDYEGL